MYRGSEFANNAPHETTQQMGADELSQYQYPAVDELVIGAGDFNVPGAMERDYDASHRRQQPIPRGAGALGEMAIVRPPEA